MDFLGPQDRQSIMLTDKEARRDILALVREIDLSKIPPASYSSYRRWLASGIEHMPHVRRIHFHASSPLEFLSILARGRFPRLQEFASSVRFLEHHLGLYPLHGVVRITIHQLDAARIDAPDVVDLNLVVHQSPDHEEEDSVRRLFTVRTPRQLQILRIEQCSQELWDRIMEILAHHHIRLREIHLSEHRIANADSTRRYLDRIFPSRLTRIISDPLRPDRGRDPLLAVFLRSGPHRLCDVRTSILTQADVDDMILHPIETFKHSFPSRIYGPLTLPLEKWAHLHTLEIPLMLLARNLILPESLRSLSLGHGHNMMDIDSIDIHILVRHLLLALESSRVVNMDLAAIGLDHEMILPFCRMLRRKPDLQELIIGDVHGLDGFSAMMNILCFHGTIRKLRCWITFQQIHRIIPFLLRLPELRELHIYYAYHHIRDQDATNQDMLRHVLEFVEHFVTLDIGMPRLRALRIVLNLDNQPIFTPEIGRPIRARCPALENLCIGW